MHRLTSTLDRMFGKFRSKRASKIRKGITPLKHRAFAMEPLEERTLLSVSPLGDETLLNGYTAGTQQLYDSGDAVAAMPDGGYVVTWTSEDQDGSGNGVYAQRFDADGETLGSEFLVNSTTAWGQQRSSVAVDADGGFVVVWDSYGQDGILAGVFGQRYDAQGQAVGGEFQINETSIGHQCCPAVACLEDGGFAVVWSGPGNGDLWGVFGRRYDSDGVADGGEFLVNSETNNIQRSAAVAAMPESGFVVVWQSHGGQDGDVTGIFGQRFDADCDPVGDEFQVNTTTDDRQQNPAVAANADGRFTVVWQSRHQDGDDYGVFAQRFDADGTTLGGEFQVNTYTANDQEYPSITYNADGGFVVAWSGKGSGDSHGVYAREFDADGNALGNEVLVNQTTSQWQQYPTLATVGDEYVVVWSGRGTGDNDGVFLRRLGPSLSTVGIADVSVAEDAADTTLDLSASFADPYNNPLTYEIVDNTNVELFDAASIDGDQLTLDYAADQSGSAELTIRATNSLGEFIETAFTIYVSPYNDAPTVLSFDPISVAEDSEPVTFSLGNVFQDIDDWFYGLRFEIMSNDNPSLFTSVGLNAAINALVLEFAPETSGTANIVIRATDEEGLWAEATVPVTVSTVNDAPVAAHDSTVLARQDADPTVLDLAALFSDADDSVENLYYEIISNDNQSLVTTQLQNSQLTLSYSQGTTGTATIVVRAADSFGYYDEGSYHTINVTVSATNLAPQITGLLDAPDPAIEGATLYLTATEVIDDTAVSSVAFWRDVDGDDAFDPAVDQLLGTDADGSDGWAISVSSAGFGKGAQRYFAQATDEDNLSGNVATATGVVGAVAILDNSAAGYAETGTGWTDNASGGYLDTARRHEAGSGTNTATWTFDGLMVKLHEVFITWQAESGLASNTQFSIYDGEQLLGTLTVDQRVTPDDVDSDGVGWLSLGEYTITSGQLTVVLTDAADGAVVADAVRVVDPPPTIESLSVTSTVSRPDDVTLTANNVADSDGTVVEVSFYRDTNGNSVYDSGTDELLGTDTSSDGGWSIAADTLTFETGTQTYFARAKDNAGLYSTTAWAQGVVEGPVAYGATSAYEGNTYTLQLDPTDIAITQWTIDWGDGSSNDVVSGSTRSLTHVYADGPNSWTIEVTGTDGVDTYYANTIDVDVSNVEPYLSISGVAEVTEGSQYTLYLDVDDPGADTITGWEIDWGDGGAPEYFSGNPSSVVHYYADGPGDYTITATADDEDGADWALGGDAGALDYSFGTDGTVTTALSTGAGVEYGWVVAVDGNGKIVVAGEGADSADILLARYNTDGTLDTSFGDGGRVVTDLGGYDFARAIAIQPDGKIVVAGQIINPENNTYDFMLARYHSDGTLDLSFGDGGRVITNVGGTDACYSIDFQSDGKIIASGFAYTGGGGYNFAIARYTSDGRLDPSFDDDGMLTTNFNGSTDYARAVVVLPDDSILVVGQAYNGSNYDFALAKYDEDGELDPDFDGNSGGNGKVTTAIGAGDDIAYAVAVDGDTIIVAGYSYNGSNNDIAVACYDLDYGTLDTNFGTNGKYTLPIGGGNDEAYAVAVKSNGDILVAGRTHNGSNYDFAVVCYDVSENDLDDGFGDDGVQTFSFGSSNDSAYSMALLEGNNQLLVFGQSIMSVTSYDFALARLVCDTGVLDSDFDGDSGTGDGKVTTDFPGRDNLRAAVVQADQKIVVAGYSYVDDEYEFTLSRYNTDGTLDTNFGVDGTQTTDVSSGSTDYAYDMALQADQKIIVVGYSSDNFGIARYTTDGILDTTFSGDGLKTTDIAGSTDYATAVAVQSDGDIVVAGYAYVSGSYDFAVVRYNDEGVLDTSFNGIGKKTTAIGSGTDYANAVALQTIGGEEKILVAGQAYINGDYDFAIVRYDEDGTLDEDFDGDDEQNPGNGIVTYDFGYGDDIIYDIVVLDDGKILVSGSAENGGTLDFAMARFNDDGTLDTTFGASGVVLTSFAANYDDYAYSIQIQSDDKILLGGMTYYNGHEDFVVARYTDLGVLDSTFDGDGKVTTDFNRGREQGFAMALQSDDRIVLAGKGHDDFQLVRYLPGEVDHTITVTNAAPTLSVVDDQTIVVDCELSLTDIGTFVDPGFDTETYSYTINWGDGSAVDQGMATIDIYGEDGVSTEGSFDGVHTYTSTDTYTVTVTLSDGDNQDVETFYVTVRDSAVYTWDGGGADDYWTTAENWVGDVAPLPGDQLYFTSVSAEEAENDFPEETVFESITFASADFELSGNGITLTDGITVNSAATGSEINLDINLDGSIEIDVATGADLTIYGELYGAGSLTKTGGGTLILAGPVSYTGGTTVSDGDMSYVAMDRDENVLEGTQLSFDLNSSDFLIGAMQEPLTYHLEETDPTPPTGLDFNAIYNRITWTPDTNWGGYCPTICVTATDATGDVSATQTIFITVYDQNRSPEFNGSLETQAAFEGQTYTYNFSSSANNYYVVDPDEADETKTPAGLPATLTYTLEDVDLEMYNGGTGPSIDSETGVFSWTPSEAHGWGYYDFKVRVTDEGGLSVLSSSINICVSEVDVASIISGPSSVTVDNRLSARERYTLVDPDNIYGDAMRLTGNVPSGLTISGEILKWDPSTHATTGTYQINIELYDEYTQEVFATKAVTVNVTAENAHTPVDSCMYVVPSPAWQACFTAAGPDAIVVSLGFYSDNPESPPETTTYTVSSWSSGFTNAPTISSEGMVSWTILRQDPRGYFYYTVRMTDNGNPAYASTITCWGRVCDAGVVTYAVANDGYANNSANSTEIVTLGSDMCLCSPTVVDEPEHGELSNFQYCSSGSGYYFCYYTPDEDFHGVDTFTYYYPTVYSGQDPILLQSRTATVTIAVDPVVVEVDVEGEFVENEVLDIHRAIIPENVDWSEEGLSAGSRVADDLNDGIVADDSQLRDATVSITNNFDDTITGYWSPTFITNAGGWSIQDYGSRVRAYQNVDSQWREIFTYEEFMVTLDPHETLEVPLLLEGITSTGQYDLTFTVNFHVVNIDDEPLQGGLRSVMDTNDYVHLTVSAVDFSIGPTGASMPEVYEDDLPYVVPLNRDYDEGYLDSGNPVPDCTDPLPLGVTPLDNESYDDELVDALISFPLPFHGTWTLIIPDELRVWQYNSGISQWEEVVSGLAYEFNSTLWCMSVDLRVEGITPSAAANYLTVIAQYTDAEDAPIGTPIDDRVKFEVVSIDLEVAGISELDEETQQAFVPLNDDYDEGNKYPNDKQEAVTDNELLHGQPISIQRGILIGDDDLVHATLTIDGPNGQTGKYWIEVLNEPTYAQYVLVWLPDGTQVPRTRETAKSITLDANAVDLLIEGLAEYYSSQNPLRLIAHFEPNGDYAKAGVEGDISDSIIARVIELELDADVDSKNDSGYTTPDNNDEEDCLEKDPSTGKIVWTSTADIDGDEIVDYEDFDGIAGAHFVPMILRLSNSINDLNPSEITISITYDSDILRIWMPGKDASVTRTIGDIIASGAGIPASSLIDDNHPNGLEPGGSVIVFIEALQSNSSTLPIIVSTTIIGEDGSGTLTDKVHVAAAEFKYVRVYDTHKIPNRSTRAVGVPEVLLDNTHLYEDNPRSDYDAPTTPGIVFGGWGENMADALISVEAEFDGPEWIGEHILWNISANNGCRIDDDTSGSFSSSKTVISSVIPSAAERRTHAARDDIVINVGVDANGNGVLESSEHSVPSFQNRLIGKAEYDYCYDSLTGWLITLGGMWYTQAGELLEIFTDTDIVADYDSTRIVTQTYGGTHNQSNALGFDETVNIIQGTVTEYTWNSDSSFSSKVLAHDAFFDRVIRPAVEGLKIDEFYDNNPSVSEHTFTVQINTGVLFSTGDLDYALQNATISFVLTIYTERGTTIPEITGVKGNGACIDFYDFRTHRADDGNGWASRVQACHSQNYRDSGEVFWVHIDLDVPEYFFWIDVYYNDLDELKDKWQGIV